MQSRLSLGAVSSECLGGLFLKSPRTDLGCFLLLGAGSVIRTLLKEVPDSEISLRP